MTRVLSPSFSQEHADLCHKYGQPYKNEHSWGMYARTAQKHGETVEQYLGEPQKAQQIIYEHRKLLWENGVGYKSEISWSNCRRSGLKAGVSIDEWLAMKKKSKKLERMKSKLLMNYGKQPENWGGSCS